LFGLEQKLPLKTKKEKSILNIPADLPNPGLLDSLKNYYYP